MMARVALSEGKGEAARDALRKVDAEATGALPYVVWLQAQAAKMAGRYEEAGRLYAGLVETDDHRLLPYWRVEYADLLMSQRDFPRARKAYNEILDKYPQFPQEHVAVFRLAQCQFEMGDTRTAARTFYRVYRNWPWKEEGEKARQILDSQYDRQSRPGMGIAEHLEWASELRRQKHWETSRAELERLMERVKTERGHSKIENEVRQQLALIDYERQDYDAAIPALTALNERFEQPGQSAGLGRDFVRRLLQRAYHRSGDAETALQILKSRIKGRPSRAQDRELGEFYLTAGDYLKAFKHLDRTYARGARQGFDYAYLLFKAKRYTQAARHFDQLRRFARGELGAKYNYWYARAIAGDGKLDEAKAIWKEVAKEHPLSYYGLQSENRLTDAAQARVKAYKAIAYAPEAISSVNLPEPDHTPHDGAYSPLPPLVLAASATGPASPAPVTTDRGARIYWAGPEAPPTKGSRLGRPEPKFGMRAYVDGVQNLGAARVLAMQHGDIWPELKTAAFLHEVGMHFDAQQEMRGIALEYRGLRGAGRPADGRPIRLGYRKNAHYIDHRGSARRGFWGMGAGDLRFPVSRLPGVRRQQADRQQAIYDRRPALDGQLIRGMKEVGEYHLVRRWRLERGGHFWRTLPEEDRFGWSEAYPRAFPLLVEKYAAQEGLDPYLLWALMTVESAYNPDSVSYANARGLLQVIPKTGHKVAQGIGDRDFGPYDLLKPETSVRHGAWYFSRLVRKFHGQEPFAIASYNGGPHNVQRWLKHKEHVPLDEFVEEIPFDQARGYTKKVLRFVALFRRLYEDKQGLYVGQSIDAVTRVDPRY